VSMEVPLPAGGYGGSIGREEGKGWCVALGGSEYFCSGG